MAPEAERLLTISHFTVLTILTILAFLAILSEDRYAKGIIDFNAGVLPLTWRGDHCGTHDEYSLFCLSPQATSIS